jgi:hypothetical protein
VRLGVDGSEVAASESPERVPAVSRARRASKWYRRLSFMMPQRPLQLRQCLPTIGGAR